MSFGIPVRNGLAVGLLSSTFLSSRRAGGPFSGASLYLNMLTGTLDSRVTFSRGGNATLVDGTGRIVYAPANLLLWSQEFDNAAWVKLNSLTVTANSTAAPDGTLTADTLIEPAATNIFGVRQPATLAAGTATFSVFIKPNGRNWVQLTVAAGGSGSAFFNVATGVVGTTSGATASIVNAGNGWYRCVLVCTASAGSNTLDVRLASADGTTSYTGNGTSGIFIWGAQLEPVTYQTVPGPYVATTSAAYYGPRFDYNPVTLAPLGLLIEEQRTNLLTYSAQFDDAAWAKSNTTVTANAAASPDGTANANKLTPTTTNADHFVRQTVTVANATHTYTVYAKADGYGFLAIQIANSVLYAKYFEGVFNLTTGVVEATGRNSTYTGTSSITALANGWYRCQITVNNIDANSTTIATVIPLSTNNPSATYAGNGTSGILAWGAQLEAGAFATSYIPTVASQVTRLADVATMTGTNFSSWYNASEGTFFTESSMLALNTAITQELLALDDSPATSNNIFLRANNTAGSTSATATTAGASQGFLDIAGAVAGVTQRVAHAIKLNDAALTRNGGAVIVDTTYAVPTGLIRMAIGQRLTGAGFLNGHIRQIAYFNTRLPNAQLEALTAPPLITSLSLDFLNGVYEG